MKIHLEKFKRHKSFKPVNSAESHPVVGGTGRFAHDLSEESWPWWTGPAGPARLKQSKQSENNNMAAGDGTAGGNA